MLRLAVIDRLVLRELSGPMLNSFFLFLALLFNSVYLPKMTDLMVRGASFSQVLMVTFYALPALVTKCFPMALLLGCLLSFGRLSGDSEHIAGYAGGISFYRMARPIALVGVLVSIAAFTWNETVVPRAMARLYAVMYEAAKQAQKTDDPIFYSVKRPKDDALDEVVSIAGGYDKVTQSLKRVTIVKMSEDATRPGQPEVVIYADRVVAKDEKGLNATLYDVSVRYLRPGRDMRRQTDFWFKELELKAIGENVRLDRDFRGVPAPKAPDNDIRTFQELRDLIREERAEGKDTGALEVNLWEKIAFPIASVIFGLVGAPLGVRPQRGSKAMGFGIAIMIIFAYWLVHNGMFQLGKGGTLPPVVAAFASNILGILAAAFLMSRTRQ